MTNYDVILTGTPRMIRTWRKIQLTQKQQDDQRDLYLENEGCSRDSGRHASDSGSVPEDLQPRGSDADARVERHGSEGQAHAVRNVEDNELWVMRSEMRLAAASESTRNQGVSRRCSPPRARQSVRS
jgi:hypothetical protein